MSAAGTRLEFEEYIALGDSLSLDLYPALDAGQTDVAVALERVERAGETAPLGAASLLFRNAEEQWPDDAGEDLISRYAGLAFTNLATDDASIGDVFGEQLDQVPRSDRATLFTLTVGSNDLFSAFTHRGTAAMLEAIVRDVAEAYGHLVRAIQQVRPRSLLVLSTIPDPSDRTGRVDGVFEGGRYSLGALDRLNAAIRELAGHTPGTVLADVYLHFLGHGASVEEKERWFWRRSPLEPNAVGASEMRKVWLEAVRGAAGE
ncbi:MAG: GDSL-type esterase/lipase family protein [Gemmatimonadaceae bacterium]